MKHTFIVSFASWCGGGCPGCPFQTGSSGLSVDALQKTLEFFDRLDECVVVCSWSQHPDLYRMAKMLFDKSRRVVWLISPSELGNLAKNKIALTLSDEFFVVLHGRVDMPLRDNLRALLSSTDSAAGIWWIAEENPFAVEKFNDVMEAARSMGLRLILGETPYSCSGGVDPVLFASRRGAEISLPIGQRCGYTVSKAFLRDYPSLLLLRPVELPGVLYLSPEGVLKKHPKHAGSLPVSELTLDTLRRLLLSRSSPCEYGLSFHVEMELCIRERNTGTVITPQILALLEAIHNMRSIKGACSSLGIPYQSCIEKIRSLEKSLGKKLVRTSRGGKARGSCYLTELGLQILETYREALTVVYQNLPL
ncbi:MAG: LysR family transcriptional regulator [Thermofilum sp.]|nr:LysR family transcriptional regulator [Thermofilum sp.]